MCAIVWAARHGSDLRDGTMTPRRHHSRWTNGTCTGCSDRSGNTRAGGSQNTGGGPGARPPTGIGSRSGTRHGATLRDERIHGTIHMGTTEARSTEEERTGTTTTRVRTHPRRRAGGRRRRISWSGDRTEHFTDSFVRAMGERNIARMQSIPPLIQQHVIYTYGPKDGKELHSHDKYFGGVIRGHTPAGAVRHDGGRKYAYDCSEQNGDEAELPRMYAIREIRAVQIRVAVQASPRPRRVP